MKPRINRGQSLFEVVVAIALISIIITTIVSLTIISLKNNIHARNKTVSQNLANEAYEWLREQKTNDWTNFQLKADSSKVYCMDTLVLDDDDGCGVDEIITQQGAEFTRTVILTRIGADSNSVNTKINVAWSEAGKTFNTETETILNKLQ